MERMLWWGRILDWIPFKRPLLRAVGAEQEIYQKVEHINVPVAGIEDLNDWKFENETFKFGRSTEKCTLQFLGDDFRGLPPEAEFDIAKQCKIVTVPSST